VFLYHFFQRRCLTCARASQWLTTTCYKEFGRNSMCVELRMEHILNTCNVPQKNLVSFPFHQY
jgi:hypothetical protein